MSERNTIALFTYESALIDAASWIARVAYLRGSLSDSASLAFRWFASYGLKIEIQSGSLGFATALRSNGLDVHKAVSAMEQRRAA